MQYRTGYVTISGESLLLGGSLNEVRGIGTTFLTEVEVGDSFKLLNDWNIHTVSSVDGNEALTITPAYSGENIISGEYQISRDWTPTLELQEINPGDIDWPIHLTTNVIRRIDTLLGHNAVPQFAGLKLSSASGESNTLFFTQLNPVVNTWYDTDLVVDAAEAFSGLINVLYEDENAHGNDRSCLAHIGGYGGPVSGEAVAYLSRPNGEHIELQFISGEMQVRQIVNSSLDSKLTVFGNYMIHV